MLRFQELNVNLKVKKFSIDDLGDAERDTLLDVFTQSYQKSTGAAFSTSEFYGRARYWIFFGNADANGGGIAVRKQNQLNAFKLNACYGNPLAIIAGFKEMLKQYPSMPVWGAMTPNLVISLTKRMPEFKVVPMIVVRAVFKSLQNVSSDIVGLTSKGIKVQTPAGVMEKQLVANKEYFKLILKSAEDPQYQSSIPAAARLALKPALGILRMMVGIKKSDMKGDD
jgi:hypothetical protein